MRKQYKKYLVNIIMILWQLIRIWQLNKKINSLRRKEYQDKKDKLCNYMGIYKIQLKLKILQNRCKILHRNRQ